MRLPLTLVLLLLTAGGVLAYNPACSPGSTVVKVVDCSGAVVQGARIDIKVCCAANQQQQFSAVSAANGEARFEANAREICDGKVSFAGFSPTVFGTGSCSKPDKDGNSLCGVQVCKR